VLEEFKKHITTKFQLLKHTQFLLACSGGIDSVVLAHLCATCNLDFSIAHCNFHLRGTDSNEDESFVKELAKQLGKPFLVTHFDTKAYVTAEKTSVQIAARELRYAWFLEQLKVHNLKYIATAHHADDAIETFLINLSRGTGIDGLLGIPEKTETLVRPLLKFSRAQILDYAMLEKIQWREDKSNEETKYIRNKIRHQILPVLKELHPTFLDNFKNTQEFLGQTAAISEQAIKEVKSKLFVAEEGIIKINIASLAALHPLEGYIYGLFKPYKFTALEDIISLLSSISGKEIYSKTHRLIKDRTFLLLQELEEEKQDASYKIIENDTVIKEPISLRIDVVTRLEEKSESILYVAREMLKFPLIVRKWKKGDYFYPFGMQGKKKVAKFFKDEKMNTLAKEKQWLLCSGDTIVWIIGKRADNRFKVAKNTQEILKFTLDK